MIIQCDVKSTTQCTMLQTMQWLASSDRETQCTMYNAQCSLQITFQCSGLLCSDRETGCGGEQQTEILSVNGKPSEYRSLNIHHTLSGFVIRFFFKVYFSIRTLS